MPRHIGRPRCLEPLTPVRALAVGKKIMPRARTAAPWTELTLEERRERRRLRREKQREDNIKRAAKMHAARLKAETKSPKHLPEPEAIDFCRMLRLALLEMAGFVLCRCAAERLVRALPEDASTPSKSTHPFTHGRRLQAFRPGGASPARKSSSTPSRSASSSPTSRSSRARRRSSRILA